MCSVLTATLEGGTCNYTSVSQVMQRGKQQRRGRRQSTSLSSVLRPEKVSERSTSAASTAACMRSWARWMRRADLRARSGTTPRVGDGVEGSMGGRCLGGVPAEVPPAAQPSIMYWQCRNFSHVQQLPNERCPAPVGYFVQTKLHAIDMAA